MRVQVVVCRLLHRTSTMKVGTLCSSETLVTDYKTVQ
jgi:hypothetical protein